MQRILPKPSAVAVVSVDHAAAPASLSGLQTNTSTYIIVPVTAFTQNMDTEVCSSTPAKKCEDSLLVHRRKRLHTTKENSENFIAVTSPNPRLKRGRVSTVSCKRCSRSTDEPCLKHAFAIKDLPTAPKAYASLPAELYVADKDARLGTYHVGVFAKTAISHPTVFGPLVAPVNNDTSPSELRFALRETNGKTMALQVFDLECDDLCNWMKFVRKAVDGDQQNLVAFCEEDNVYFSTTKDIPADTELRFCYSQRYSKLMRTGNLRQQDGVYMHLPEPDEDDFHLVRETMEDELVDDIFRETEVLEDEVDASTPADFETAACLRNKSTSGQDAVNRMTLCMPVKIVLQDQPTLKPKKFHSYKCTAGCDLRFRIKKLRDLHSMRHREADCSADQQVAKCPECDFKASAWIDLWDHIDGSHHVINPRTLEGEDGTDWCRKKRKHCRTTGLYDCSDAECNYSFGSEILRDLHVLRHGATDSVGAATDLVRECPECHLFTGDLEALLSHVEEAHSLPKRRKKITRNITVKSLLQDQENLKSKRFRSYKCTTGCDLRFAIKKSRDIHSMRHGEGDWSANQQVPECPGCDFKASTLIDLLDHLDGSHHVVNPLTVESDDGTDKCTEKRKHRRTMPHLYDCNDPECKYTFTTEKLRNLHVLRHGASESGDSGSMRECPECHVVTGDAETLLSHVEESHSLPKRKKKKKKPKLYKKSDKVRNMIRRWSSCAACGLQFRTKKLLDLHALQHTGYSDAQKVCRCVATSCSFSCDDMEELLRHVVKRHAHTESHYCSRCNKVFTTLKRLELHIKRIHIWSDSEKPFECGTCHKKFSENSSYTRHLGVHAGPNYIICYVCPEAFPSRTALHSHLLEVHAVDGLLSCDVCGKTFPPSCKEAFRAFRTHIRTHAADGHFECEICKKVFSRQYKLVSHKESHRVTRDYVCECGKSFAGSGGLAQHRQVVHKEGKIKQVTYAIGGEPSQKSKAKERTGYVPPQKLKHYTEFPFSCEDCRQGFCRRGMLAYHFTVRHPERSLDSVPQLALSSTEVHLNQR